MKKYCILYKDVLLRKGRMDNCEPFSFSNKKFAEDFILDHRANEIDKGIVARRSDYYVFDTETELGIIQG
jgi:hypothetical protein